MTTIFLVLAIVAVAWISLLSAVFMGGLVIMILAALFVVLRLTGIVEWSWWWVTLPIWGVGGWAIGKMWIVTRDPLWREKIRWRV
jgi:hypothetical protein